MQLTIADNLQTLQQALVAPSKDNKRIALVPTMGALHPGHMMLIKEARQRAEVVVASIFVNPLQFGANEDFHNYPRPLDADITKLSDAGVDVLYAPTAQDMYPAGFSTHVNVGPLGEVMCGKSRPGHFNGVATVVTKLFLRILPHMALFGEKDYQQLCILNHITYDLDIPIQIIGVPTVREADGLAMSSRNAYLTPEQRKIAPQLYETLCTAAARIANKKILPPAAITEALARLVAIGFKPDYLEMRAEGSLDTLDSFQTPARLLVAAWLGNTRLIDNVVLDDA